MSPVPVMQSPPGAEVTINGRRCLYFAGTAYLALQGHPAVVRAMCEAARRYGVGAATTRAGYGHQPPTLEAEAAAARYFGRPAAFYFPSGYSGPAILLAALAGDFDAAFVDEQAHYAIIDALHQHELPIITFGHRDAADLKKQLAASLELGQRPLVISDGVFAASGRIAPVDQYIELLKDYAGSALLLDDAHGVGVLGAHGRGTFEHFGIPAGEVNDPAGVSAGPVIAPGPRFYACATLSKALGAYGGIIAGSASFIRKLREVSHIYEGCSAPPAPIAAAAAAALDLLTGDPTPRRRLMRNAQQLRKRLGGLGLEIDLGPTPVVALDLGDERIMQRVHGRLLEQAIAIGYLRYAGTHPCGALRIAVCAAHTEEMIDHLVAKLREAL